MRDVPFLIRCHVRRRFPRVITARICPMGLLSRPKQEQFCCDCIPYAPLPPVDGFLLDILRSLLQRLHLRSPVHVRPQLLRVHTQQQRSVTQARLRLPNRCRPIVVLVDARTDIHEQPQDEDLCNLWCHVDDPRCPLEGLKRTLLQTLD